MKVRFFLGYSQFWSAGDLHIRLITTGLKPLRQPSTVDIFLVSLLGFRLQELPQEDLGADRGTLFKAAVNILELEVEMKRTMVLVLYSLALIAVVISIDLLFFKNRSWERLIVNAGIALVFATFYLRYLKNL
jgi:hypothetical protein